MTVQRKKPGPKPKVKTEEPVEKNKVGRPSLLTPEFLKNAELVINNIMGQGGFLVEVAVELGVSKETIRAWCNEGGEFSVLMQKGKALQEAWYCKIGRQNLHDKDFNQHHYKWMSMNVIKDWKNKQDVQGNVSISDAVQSAANKRLEKLDD